MAPDHAAHPWTGPPRGIGAPALAALVIGAATVALAVVGEVLDRREARHG